MNDILLLGIFLSLIFTELTDLSPGGNHCSCLFRHVCLRLETPAGNDHPCPAVHAYCPLYVQIHDSVRSETVRGVYHDRRTPEIPDRFHGSRRIFLHRKSDSRHSGPRYGKTGHTENTDSAGNRDSFNPSYLHNCEVAQ